MATTTTITTYPWQPESTETALRAIGDLGVGLMNALKTQRGVHTESLLTVATHFTRLLATGCRNGGWAPPGLRKASRSHAFDSPMPGECRSTNSPADGEDLAVHRDDQRCLKSRHQRRARHGVRRHHLKN
jgi:hypothetical protein